MTSDSGRGASADLVAALHRWVDPVLAQAGFSWNDSGEISESDGRLVAVLYEADPDDFVRRYPQTRLQSRYGDQWPPPCVDLWLKFDWDARRIELDLEGFDVRHDLHGSGIQVLAEGGTQLSGDANEDARAVAAALASVLSVTGPEPSTGDQG